MERGQLPFELTPRGSASSAHRTSGWAPTGCCCSPPATTQSSSRGCGSTTPTARRPSCRATAPARRCSTCAATAGPRRTCSRSTPPRGRSADDPQPPQLPRWTWGGARRARGASRAAPPTVTANSSRRRRWRFQHVSIGNPQCAIHVEDLPAGLSTCPRSALRSKTTSSFPNRTNVSWYTETEPVPHPRADLRARGGGDALLGHRRNRCRGRPRSGPPRSPPAYAGDVHASTAGAPAASRRRGHTSSTVTVALDGGELGRSRWARSCRCI